MKILVAPDKFKGSLTAVAAAEAIARGFREVLPDAELELAPIADGGEGFAEALCLALDGKWVHARALDPIGREVDARYVWIVERKLAVIEMSEASGLWRLKPEERAPLRANTFGTGQLMRHAVERGAEAILIGLGGSATTDGGAGMAAALGFEFLTSDGEPIAPEPRNFLALETIHNRGAIQLPPVIAACDVQNPLLGERGTARVFSPQKGSDPETVKTLELGMENFADVVKQSLGCDFRDTPGAGAAGGIGFGLISFCNAQIRSGFTVIAKSLELEQRVAAADLIVTGEGRIDGQTLEGKGPAGIAALAHNAAKPVLAFGGSITEDHAVHSLFTAAIPIVDSAVSLDEAMRRGSEFLERAARRTAQLLHLGKSL